jgi:hypothetical protein
MINVKKIAAILMFVFIIQNILAYTWKPVVTPAGGAIQDIVYSKLTQGLIYMRTDMGGAYRWDNANNIWVPLTDWLGDWNLYGIESIAPDPKNANLVYAAIGQSYNSSNGYLIVSSDQGNSWTQYPMPVIIAGNDSGNYAGERLAVDPDNTAILYYGSRSGGLWKSTNSGVNWSQVTSFPVNGDSGHGLSYVIFDPNSATGSGCNNIYVGVMALNSGNSNIYRSTNGGANWSLISGGPSGMSTSQASLGSDSNLWIVYNNDNSGPTTGQIWKLNISTLGWNNVTPSNGPQAPAGGYSGICVDAQNAQHAVVSTMDWYGGTDKCFQTTNGGNSWTIIANVQNNWNSGPYPNYDINGAPWTRFCSPYNGGAWLIASVKIDPFNSNNAIYTTGGGIWSTKNVQAPTQPQGITWTFTDYGIEQTAVLFLCPSYKSGVFFSCLGDISGMRYTNLDSPAPDKYCDPAFGNTNCIDYAENSTSAVARVGSSGSVASDTAFSSDNGQSWSPGAVAPPDYGTSNQMRSCAMAADGSRVVVCPNNGYGNPAYTTNSGGSWTTCNGLPSGSDLASDRVNASIIFATNGSNLYRSLDGGANFSVINSFSGSGVPRAVFGVTGEVWVATGNGLYRFANNGLIKATISNVSSANSVGFGKAAPGQSHPAVYLTGNVGGTYGFYRCDDGTGTSWVRINDNNHQYGYGAWCGGDQEIYGRMYVGTNGRGTLYCDSAPAGTATPTTTGTPPTVTFTQTITRTSTITPTFTVTPMQCNNWIYTGETPYNLSSGGSYIATSGTVSEVTTQYHSASHSMDINFVWSDGYYQGMGYNWANWNTSSSGIYNASSATAIDLWLLSGSGTVTTLSISIVDSSGANSNSIPVTNYLTGGVTTSWQELKIPLSAFTGVNLTALWELNINTGGSQSGNQTIYLDDFSFLLPCGTPTNTPAITNTFTQTKTVTTTVVYSPTSTVTATGTSTQTATRTFTATMTNSFTPSPTPTFSRTPTIGNTATCSPTNTWTFTAGATATYTLTVTDTPLSTATDTGTAVFTVTDTPTGTISQTDTVSPTVTESCTGTPPTATPSFTYTPTGVDSPTPTVTNTATSTWTTASTPSFTTTLTITETTLFTFTATATITQTWTETPVLVSTWTFTMTTTLTPEIAATDTTIPTKTITPSFTGTLTTTVTVAITPTFTPAAMETGEIVYPNPYDPSKGDLNIIYSVSDSSDTIKVRFYTRAFRLILEESLYPSAAGINKGAISAGLMNGFANGVYFYSVFSSDKNGGEKHGIINKVIILR